MKQYNFQKQYFVDNIFHTQRSAYNLQIVPQDKRINLKQQQQIKNDQLDYISNRIQLRVQNMDDNIAKNNRNYQQDNINIRQQLLAQNTSDNAAKNNRNNGQQDYISSRFQMRNQYQNNNLNNNLNNNRDILQTVSQKVRNGINIVSFPIQATQINLNIKRKDQSEASFTNVLAQRLNIKESIQMHKMDDKNGQIKQFFTNQDNFSLNGKDKYIQNIKEDAIPYSSKHQQLLYQIEKFRVEIEKTKEESRQVRQLISEIQSTFDIQQSLQNKRIRNKSLIIQGNKQLSPIQVNSNKETGQQVLSHSTLLTSLLQHPSSSKYSDLLTIDLSALDNKYLEIVSNGMGVKFDASIRNSKLQIDKVNASQNIIPQIAVQMPVQQIDICQKQFDNQSENIQIVRNEEEIVKVKDDTNLIDQPDQNESINNKQQISMNLNEKEGSLFQKVADLPAQQMQVKINTEQNPQNKENQEAIDGFLETIDNILIYQIKDDFQKKEKENLSVVKGMQLRNDFSIQEIKLNENDVGNQKLLVNSFKLPDFGSQNLQENEIIYENDDKPMQ